jgi:16S rRNA (guanine966-N2)-methyltransferase
VVAADARRPGDNPGSPHDLIFLDPPYGKGLGEAALSAALAGGWIAPGALIVWEESAAIAPPLGLRLIEERRYGATMIRFLEVG